MAIIRRCGRCRRWYLAIWSSSTVRYRDKHTGQPVGKPLHGHERCMRQVAAEMPDFQRRFFDAAALGRLQRLERIVSGQDGGESPFGWRTGS